MDYEKVAEAVTELQARSETPSVRAVHRLVGGSFSDLAPLIKMALSSRGGAGEAGAVAVQAAPGEIAQAQAALEAALAHAKEMHQQSFEAFIHWRTLRNGPPPPDPHGQAAHHEALHQAAQAVESWNMPKECARLACEQARAKLETLERRRDELTHHLLRLRNELVQILTQEGENEERIAFMLRSNGWTPDSPQGEHLARSQREAFQERLTNWRRAICDGEAALARLQGETPSTGREHPE